MQGPRVVARSRVRFLTSEPVDPSTVRSPILASWQRSRELRVAAEKIEQSYSQNVDTDSPLARSAAPVLRNLRQQLDGQPMSIILTDPTGLVLSRQTGDGDLERYLDQVLLAPGFSYAEQFVGTNGIGTALEVGGPTQVFGHEHYAENLDTLACAGVPIRHPMSGRTVGAVDLTCWSRDAGPLLLTLAKTTAEQIRQALMSDTAAHQQELLHEYLRACRRVSGIVLALDQDVVMLNDHARTLLDPADQAAVVLQASEAIVETHRRSVVVELPSGRHARLSCRPVPGSAGPSGVVVHVRLDEPGRQSTDGRARTSRMPLPGLVGSGVPWLRACDEVERAFRAGEWLAVQGEPGVGKTAMLKAVQLRRQPVGRLSVLDAATADANPDWLGATRDVLLGDVESVVIQHVDHLDASRLRGLAAALEEARLAERAQPLWVAVTLGPTADREDLARSLRLFPSTVAIPPLRLHLEDLPQLVSFFLGRLGQGEHLVCSPAAMQLLMRATWPGNTGQVLATLRHVVQHRRTGSIQVEDLPPQVRTVSRRLLSQMESLERDAIVQSLVAAHGNKSKAAADLGMSRATIYRKIHEYGIRDMLS